MVNYGKQAAPNFAIAIDPNNTRYVYVSGDRIQNSPYTATVFRIDAVTNDYTPITDNYTSNGSTLHADTRAFAFDGSGRLILVSDGGVYARSNPQSDNGQWTGLHDGLSAFQVYTIAYDANSNRLFTASQDTGVSMQTESQGKRYTALQGADGVNVTVNDQTLSGSGLSAVYSSYQSLGGLARLVIDSNGQAISPGGVTGVPVNTDISVVGSNFMSPFILNRTDPTRIAIGGTRLYVTTDTLTGGSGPDAPVVNLTLTNVGDVGSAITYIAYGADDNASIVVAGAGNGVWRSLTAEHDSVEQLTQYAGNAATAIVFDPRSQHRFFLADTQNLYGTTNGAAAAAGVTFTNLTGNLPVGMIYPTSVEFISANGVNALLVGGLSDSANAQSTIAAADSNASGALSNWRAFGQGLPNTFASSLSYNAAVDVLAVGTFGRGAWVLYDVTSNFPQATVLQFGLANNNSMPDAALLTDGVNIHRPLIKYGSGVLTIVGDATYTGDTTVNAGVLQLGNGISDGVLSGTGGLTVGSGATLRGVGTIGNSTASTAEIQAGGVISPGGGISGPSTLAFLGQLTFDPGSQYLTRIFADGQNDAITANSSLIAGGSVGLQLPDVHYLPGVSYALLSSPGGASGTFDGMSIVSGSLPGLLVPSLSYDGTHVFLDLSSDFVSAARTGNEFDVARALDAAGNAGGYGPSGAALLTILLGKSDAGAVAAFNALSGEGVSGQQEAALGAGSLFMNTILGQITFWRDNMSANDVTGSINDAVGPESHQRHRLHGGERPRAQGRRRVRRRSDRELLAPGLGERHGRSWLTQRNRPAHGERGPQHPDIRRRGRPRLQRRRKHNGRTCRGLFGVGLFRQRQEHVGQPGRRAFRALRSDAERACLRCGSGRLRPLRQHRPAHGRRDRPGGMDRRRLFQRRVERPS